jgi:hypothetical protein
MSATSQVQPVATSVGTVTQCALRPLCKLDAHICGGIEKHHCSVYTEHGKEHTPTDSELALAFQHATWSEMLAAECGFAVECGGMTRASCEEMVRMAEIKTIDPLTSK